MNAGPPDERPEKRPDERSTGGRFAKGNRAAAGRRQPRRTVADLTHLADVRLRELGERRGLAELTADAVVAVARAAAVGDLPAARWLVDRLYPPTADTLELTALPSPSRRPAAYLDALARAVARGELAPAQAASLSHLARAFLADELMRDLAAELQALTAKVDQLERRTAGGPRGVAA